MNKYSYKAYDASGRLVKGEVNSPSLKEAMASLKSKGLQPFDARPLTQRHSLNAKLFSRPSMSAQQQALILDQLAILLKAGLRIEECLSVIAEQVSDRALRDLIGRLEEQVRQGISLSDAINAVGGTFNTLDAALLRTGELRGDIASAAQSAAELAARRQSVRARLVSALVYPTILTISAVGAILIVTIVLAPTIAPMFERTGVAPPFAFAALMAFSNFLTSWWWALLLALALAAIGGQFAVRRPDLKAKLDGAILGAPVIGDIVANFEAAKILTALAALLKGGAPLPDALKESAKVSANFAYVHWLETAYGKIRRGARFSQCFEEAAKPWPTVTRRFVSIGEKTGDMAEMLGQAAAFSDHAAQRKTDRVMTALTPALTLVMGVLVGGLIAVVLTTILSANEIVFQ